MIKLLVYIRWFIIISIPAAITFGGIAGIIILVNIIYLILGYNALISWYWLIPSIAVTSWVGFPILYLFRNTCIRRIKPFWYYFDDEDEFGYNVNWFYPNKSDTFVKAYLWAAVRNPMWNLQASLKPKEGEKELVEIKVLNLKRNGVLLGDAFQEASLKYIDDNGIVGNKGPYLSKKHAIIGEVEVWYRIRSTLYFRKSKVYYKNRRWREFQIGISDTRYKFRRKYSKKDLIWK